ncbi:MAG TPA: elongation factor G-like protein EF-G2, partial [Mycobacteriales bacterium]|nr:elongation factor G-like protein EF-G2 [Mycobacteriales bacterium]
LRDAAEQTVVVVLEPLLEISVLVDDEHVGAVMSDLASRRGRVTGTEAVGAGRSLVRAEVPELEVTRYAIDLRSISHGTATFSRVHLRYEPMPSHLSSKLTSAAREPTAH